MLAGFIHNRQTRRLSTAWDATRFLPPYVYNRTWFGR
jgi:hypothetical protein